MYQAIACRCRQFLNARARGEMPGKRICFLLLTAVAARHLDGNRQSSTSAEVMKTKATKITEGTARKLSSILAAFIAWLLPALVLVLTVESSQADSATWVG